MSESLDFDAKKWSHAPAMIEPALLDHLKYLHNRTAAEEISAALDSLNGLPPFLRALLVADGTVTLLLRAYFNEQISIRTESQFACATPEPLPLLALKTGDEVFMRSVTLSGGTSGHEYVEATSLINPSLLDAELFAALIDEHVGMGEVLRNSVRGSFREVLNIDIEDEEKVGRTYAVFLSGKPSILITERFRTRLFQ
ncbi:MAG: DUF98 domain-containing protein [Gammaproteobacteria bacterium]|nr:DUF98 domain-containing protein [Gammaproteobacteria bacterium]